MTSRPPQALTPLEHTGSGSMSKHVQCILAKATLYGWWATSRLNWTGLPWTCWKETSSRPDNLMKDHRYSQINECFRGSLVTFVIFVIFQVLSPPTHVEWIERWWCWWRMIRWFVHWCTLFSTVVLVNGAVLLYTQIGKPPLSASCNPDLDLHLFV